MKDIYIIVTLNFINYHSEKKKIEAVVLTDHIQYEFHQKSRVVVEPLI